MQKYITIYFFVHHVMQINITYKEVKQMVFRYATYFKKADKDTRKIIIENLAEEYEESNLLERQFLRKEYDEIKEILFQEGKLPM